MQRMKLGVAQLNSRSLVRVSGPDATSFLQGLLTQDVETLAVGELRLACLLTPQGKFLFDLFVSADGEDLVLDVQSDRREALIQRLSIYRLRAQAQIVAADGAVWAGWGAEPAGAGWLRDPRLQALGWRAYGAAPAEVAAVEAGAVEADYDAMRLGLGVPDPARDCEPDRTYPIEADFDLLNAIDFHKGCFVGQETTSRMKRRGLIKTRMLPIVFEGAAPAAGAEVLAGELRAGEVLSGADGRAMALLRLDRIEGADLTVDGRPVKAERPAWFDAD
jgi:folate-binding protein YgfZ